VSKDKYNFQETELKWIEKWQDSKIFEWDESLPREENFVIDTPPPTVSGTLHMGHIFSYTQADFIARYQRLKGKNVFYPIGFDDNGLPTERLVEKTKNIKALDMAREDFRELCQEVVKESEEEFRSLFRSMGMSFDWRQEYQTVSEDVIKLSQNSFLDLFKKGHIYRSPDVTIWDPSDQTALAQADLEDKEQDSFMNNIKFFDQSGKEYIIATTRPELLPACVAVFYHPDDKRYNQLAKSKISNLFTPLFGVSVPLLADENVSMEKGTGLVMCCTFGDQMDAIWWRTHNLPLRVTIDHQAKLQYFPHDDKDFSCSNLEKAQGFFDQLKGMYVKKARAKIIELLQSENLLVGQEAIKNSVKCAERSGCPVEFIVTDQWFVKVKDKKEELLKVVDESTWRPDYMKKRLKIWIENLSWDWCISRQRFFGVPFPVWYSKRAGEEGKILVPDIEELPVNPELNLPKGYSRDEVIADLDVMDTWATSSITPILPIGSMDENNDRYKKLFPSDLRPQAHEIIRTWAFYTLVKCYLHTGKAPWHNLMISGWCLANDKTKMSKSKGNIINPVDLIAKKGADVIRYWASGSKLGNDISYSEDSFISGNKLVNKLWNSAKFVAIHFENMTGKAQNYEMDINKGIIYETFDLWILSKLVNVIKKATEEFEEYEYSLARAAVEEFFWFDFCDNYLEIIKKRIYDQDDMNPAGQQSAIFTLYHVFKRVLIMLNPFMPFVTEEINEMLFSDGPLSAKGNWPRQRGFFDEKALEVGDAAVCVIEAVRKFKAEKEVSIKTSLYKVKIASNKKPKELLQSVRMDLASVINAEIIEFCSIMEDGDLTNNEEFKISMAI
jgi:valyl-tRNA synthetase